MMPIGKPIVATVAGAARVAADLIRFGAAGTPVSPRLGWRGSPSVWSWCGLRPSHWLLSGRPASEPISSVKTVVTPE
jgi:hypothetical protein